MKMCAAFVVLSASVFSGGLAFAQERGAGVAGTASEVPFQRSGSALLIDVQAAAGAFGWQAKVVTPGKLVTLCQTGAEELCIPIRLGGVPFADTQNGLFVEASVLARALGFTVEDAGDRVMLRPTAQSRPAGHVPAYNAAWGAGRGFAVGQTLPDIPLFDMNGREVRFSRFLGKQYILFCWASW